MLLMHVHIYRTSLSKISQEQLFNLQNPYHTTKGGFLQKKKNLFSKLNYKLSNPGIELTFAILPNSRINTAWHIYCIPGIISDIICNIFNEETFHHKRFSKDELFLFLYFPIVLSILVIHVRHFTVNLFLKISLRYKLLFALIN